MRRTITELLHIAVGLVGTAIVASLAVWAVPRAGPTIWVVAYLSMIAVALMGVKPVRDAWAKDQQETRT